MRIVQLVEGLLVHFVLKELGKLGLQITHSLEEGFYVRPVVFPISQALGFHPIDVLIEYLTGNAVVARFPVFRH